MNKYHFLIRLIISTVVLSSTTVHSITFDQAWEKVLQNSDTLAAERKNIERAEHLQEASSDLFLPTITLGANYTRLDHAIKVVPSDVVDSMPIDNLNQVLGSTMSTMPDIDGLLTSTLTGRDIFSSSIRALWPIYTGGRINAAQHIAKAQQEESVYLLAMKRQAKFEDLAKYYFAVVLAKQVLQTRLDVEQGLKVHFEHAQKLEAQGQINKLERLQAQASYDKSRVDRQKSLRDLEITQIALTRLLKVNNIVTPQTDLFINKSLPNMTEYLDKTLSDYPGLKILDAKKKQVSGLIDVEKGKYHPEVYLYGNYNLYEEDNLASEIAPDWEVGIGVSIPILNSSGRSGKLKAAHSSVMQINYLRAQAIQDLSVLVEKTYREANQSLEEYQGLASSIELANENFKLRTKAFAQGLSTSIDVIDAQLFIASIKTQRLAAAYKYVVSLAKLLAVSGEINSFTHYQSYQGIKVN